MRIDVTSSRDRGGDQSVLVLVYLLMSVVRLARVAFAPIGVPEV